ncbi:MAG: oligosaccharide flippase family protein [Ignavibacteria bacterium]|nr:oligosaccharide flippase family protein [Ignavibacteria bacterium]
MKDILKSSTYVGLTEALLIIVTIIKNKFIAIHIGPEGFGAVNLLASFFSIATVFSTTWLTTGLVKYISEYNSDDNKKYLAEIYNFALVFTFAISFIIVVLIFIFSDYVRNNFLSPEILYNYFFLYNISFIATSLNSTFSSALQGFIIIKKAVYLRVVNAIISLVLVIALILLYDTLGYFISILISAFVSVILYKLELDKLIKMRVSVPNLKSPANKKLFKYGGVSIFTGFLNFICQYAQRLIIISYANLSTLGLYSAVNSLVTYIGLANKGATYYYLPKMSQTLPLAERNALLNDFIKFSLYSTFPFVIISILFGQEFLLVLYSKKFVSVSGVFGYFVFAQYLIVLLTCFQSILIGQAYLKPLIFTSLVTQLLWILLPYLLYKRIGLTSLAIGFILSSTFEIVFSAIYLKIKIGLITSRKNIVIFISSVIISLATIKMIYLSFGIKMMILIIISLFAFYSLPREDRIKIKGIVLRNKYNFSKV